MSAPAIAMPRRRGACPGLSAPMPTGDGLLVRLHPIGTIPLAAFAELCRGGATARQRRHRDHLARQHPGPRPERRDPRRNSQPTSPRSALRRRTAFRFSCDPLAGIDAEEIFDSRRARRRTAPRAGAARAGGKTRRQSFRRDRRRRSARPCGNCRRHSADRASGIMATSSLARRRRRRWDERGLSALSRPLDAASKPPCDCST